MRERARKRPAVERRRDIIECAQAVFARDGFAGAASEDVAKEAGIAPSTIYRYFDTKRDLYLAVLESARSKLLALWSEVDVSAHGPLETIRELGLNYYEHVDSRAQFAQLWFQAMADASDPDVRSAIVENFTSQIDMMAKLIDAGRVAGEVRAGVDPRFAAWQFMAIGLMFDFIHHIGLDDELDRGKAEDWGETFISTLRSNNGKHGGGM